MAANPGSGICAYCASYATARTWDHVVPRAWSGDEGAASAEKLKVPACPACNGRYSKIERELTVAFGATAATDDPIMGAVAGRAMRSYTPSAAKNEKDRQHRARARRSMGDRIIAWDVVDQHPDSVLMGDVAQVDRELQFAFNLRAAALHGMGEKFVRGIKYIECGLPVTEDYEIGVQPWRGEFPVPEVEEHGVTHQIGRSVTIVHLWHPDEPLLGVFKIVLWERLVLVGHVAKREAERASAP